MAVEGVALILYGNSEIKRGEPKNKGRLEWLYCVRCNKFIALHNAMSGLPSRRKIVFAVVALLSAIRSFHIPKKSPPPDRCPPQPLSTAAVCAIRHRRAQNVTRDLRHRPPPLWRRHSDGGSLDAAEAGC